MKRIVMLNLFFIIASIFGMLYLFGEGITGYAVIERNTAIESFPELFSYGVENNNNLMDALTSITSEFRANGIEISPELLSSIMATLRKEVGTSFLPIEEAWDYCTGQGCTATAQKIYGTCRSEPYDGGCDYKGRGYIQITHRYNYEKFGGADFLTSSYDECDCVGKKYCANDCPPAKAMLPEYAGKIFAAYYIDRGLVGSSENLDFYNVGLRINGGSSYAVAFEEIAEEFYDMFTANKAKTDRLIAYLEEKEVDYGDVDSGDDDVDSRSVDDGKIDERETDDEDTEDGEENGYISIDQDTIGYYYLNPSFNVESFDITHFEDVIEDAKKFKDDVFDCIEENDNTEICVDMNLPERWNKDYCNVFSDEEKECLDQGKIPAFDDKGKMDGCISCSNILVRMLADCNNYVDERYCNMDVCNLGCVWDGGNCRKKEGVHIDEDMLKICYDTGEDMLIYDEDKDIYGYRRIVVRFALNLSKEDIDVI